MDTKTAMWLFLISLLALEHSQVHTIDPNGDKHAREEGDLPPLGPVFISEPPTDVVFANNRGTTIHCTAFGRPAPVLDWIDSNGKPLDNIRGVLEIMPNNSLHFPSFRERAYRVDVHTGRYRCTASNTAGTVVSRELKVKAVLIEQFKTYNVRVNDAYVTLGNTAIFKCLVNPYYVRDYVRVTSWTQSGKTLRTAGRFSVLQTGDLHIRHVQTEDGYSNYRCITENILTGERKTSDPATVYVMDPVISPPSIEDTHASSIYGQGETAELPCVASGYPLASYSWVKDGVAVHLDQSRILQHGGNLLIHDLGIRDSGSYRCSAENSFGSQMTAIKLTVTAPLAAHIEPAQQTIDLGRSATFNCTVVGHPVSGVTWFKDGHPLLLDSHVSLVTERVLKIRQVQSLDGGMYQCLVWNSMENVQAAAQLQLGVARPYIYESFDDQYIKPGPRMSLKCAASGNPTPSIRWTLDDGPVPLETRFSLGRYVNEDGDIISHVNISNVQVRDGGRYKCTVSNLAGSVAHVGRLHVYGVPYIRPMANVTAVARELLVLQCYVAGYPIDSISWFRGSMPLPTSDRQQVSPDGMLTIRDISRSHDEGEYSCDARNAGRQGMRSSVHIHVLEPPTIDQFQFPTRKKGERVSVSCVVSSGDLPITITWEKDDKAIPSNLGINMQKTGAYSSLLSIGDVNPRHDGNYTCIAENRAAAAIHTAHLHVDVPPRWVVEPVDTFVILHGSIMIDCQADGDPTPQIVWKKGAGKLPQDYRAIQFNNTVPGMEARLQQLDNGSLWIRKAAQEDHGYYLCHANNGIGAGLGKVLFLQVHMPAQFSGREKNYTVQLNGNISLECEAKGDRPMSIAWSFNGKGLNWSNNGRLLVHYFTTVGGRGSSLSIKPAQRDDSGFYVCNAKNLFGSDAITIKLTVQEPPDPPPGLLAVGGDSRSITVEWRRGFNGNSPITAYLLEYKTKEESWNQVNKNVSIPVSGSDDLSAVIGSLQPDCTYHIRILANNSLGLSRPSDIVIYSTDSEAPTGPPANVAALALGSKSMKVMWDPPPEKDRNGDLIGFYIGYKKYNTSAPYMYVTKSVSDIHGNTSHVHPESAASGKADQDTVYVLVLNNLEKFTKYSVHVQAFNNLGAGPRSEDVEILTLEDVPSQPPQSVHASPLSSQSIRVQWSPPPLYTLNGILQGYKVLYKPVRQDEDESDALSVTSEGLSAAIYGLHKYTNYSLQVLAYTRRGEGVPSAALYVRTQPDTPDRPADIKAVAGGPQSIMVAWRPPLHPNGPLKHYTLHIRDASNSGFKNQLVYVPADQRTYLVSNLSLHHEYGFRVRASTVVGDSPLTHEVTASTVQKAAASVASFSQVTYTQWHTDVMLQCLGVGSPAPSVLWKKRGEQIQVDERVQVLANGSLLLSNIVGTDAANYTCRAENVFGADEITVSLAVQAPPKKPDLTVAVTTPSSVQVNWRSGSNGGSKIQGFMVYFKKDHDDWTKVKVGSHNRSFTAASLQCGTRYMLNVRAFNSIGEGTPSNTVTARTNGSAPIMPPQSMVLQHINSTFIQLGLHTWLTGGCPIKAFDVEYQHWGDSVWQTVQRNVNPTLTHYKVELQPSTWYTMRVTAHNEAGSTECILKFSTKTYEGSTITPVRLVHHYKAKFYENVYIMVPLCVLLVFTIVLAVGVALWCRRRQVDLQYKAENASNLRRDLTAETSLMSDIDKQHVHYMEKQEQTYSPDPSLAQRNKNLLVLGEQKEDIVGLGEQRSGSLEDQSTWGQRDLDSGSRKSGSSTITTDEDGNIHPYATFPYSSQGRPSGGPGLSHVSCEELPPGSPADAMDGLATDPSHLPPPPPELLQSAATEQHSMPPKYQNIPYPQDTGIVLTPQTYANIAPKSILPHHNYPQGGPRPSTATLRPTTLGRIMPLHLHKGGQRQSLVSNVSDNHDELMEALGELSHPSSLQPRGYHDPDSGKGLARSNTDAGSAMPGGDTGIRAFTQSPAQADEYRRGRCEVPVYAGLDPSVGKRSSAHTPYSSRATADKPSSKPAVPPRSSPPHRLQNIYQPYAMVSGKHAVAPKAAYPTLTPDTPGADEHKPLVGAAVQPGTDRHHRPVKQTNQGQLEVSEGQGLMAAETSDDAMVV